jgi:hypothetical protein
MVAAQTGAQAAAPEPVQPFPCEKLEEEGLRVFEGIGPAAEAPAPAPILLKKKALLLRTRHPLLTRWLTFDDAALATDGGKLPPLAFRAFRIAGKVTFCTSTRRESVFGPNAQDGNFLLRCLVDEDGDGRYESHRAHGELVSYNSRTGARGKPTGAVPPLRALPRPVRLVESDAVKDPNAAFAPRILSELRVAAITDSDLVLAASSQVVMLPDPVGGRFRGGEADRITVPLREGTWTSPAGQTLVLSRKGKAWYARPAPAAVPGALLCGGSVVATGSAYSIMSEGGMSVIGRSSLPPPR